MRHFLVLIAILLAGAASAGQIDGDRYVGERFGRIEIKAPAGQWLILDREFSGNNEYGGPVVDLKATAAVAGVFPTVHVSAFKRADASVTAEFVLQTSRTAVEQKGGEPGPIQTLAVDGKKRWFFTAKVIQNDKPASLHYLLLEGEQAYFAVQSVVPEAALGELQQRIEALMRQAKY